MDLMRIYWRAIGMLAPEKRLALSLTLAGVAVAVVQLAEPILFGRVVDALGKQQSATAIIAMWAGIGLFGIIASVVVSTFADRLAHRRRLAVMNEAFERAITLPLSYHAERGTSAVVGAISNGTGDLFWIWLRAMREEVTAFVLILLLVPTAISMDWRMALILASLAAAYALLNMIAIQRTSTGQAAVETLSYNVSGRVGDVISNVTVVQSFAPQQAEIAAQRGGERARHQPQLGAQLLAEGVRVLRPGRELAHQRAQVYELNELAALEGNTMKWENRVRLDVVRQNLMRMWSAT